MTNPNNPGGDHRKLFGTSSVTAVSAAIFLCGIIVTVIITAPIKAGGENQNTESIAVIDGSRIYAPSEEIDAFLWKENETADSDTYGNPGEIIETSAIFSSPETEAPVTTKAQETTKAPETTKAAPETTKAPETTAAAPPAGSGKTSVSLLADKLGVAYTTVKTKFDVTEEELVYAAIIIQLEVMGDGSGLYNFDDEVTKYWEMLAVAQCIRNRVLSRHFPDSVNDVIFASTTVNGRVFYQFSPASKLDKCTPTEEALQAAREVLVSGVTVLPDNYYYFCASSIESHFEENNEYSLSKKANGSYDKTRGDTTTFYAGFAG